MTTGTVRSWNDEGGRGVVDSPDTPGGCWTHFGVVAVAGFRSSTPGQDVELVRERADQDGYAFRAVRARPRGQEPVDSPPVQDGPSGAISRGSGRPQPSGV